MTPLQIEGTTLEGGGQLVRLCVGLSALTSIPIEIRNIRGNRSGPPGLKGQHLSAVQWLARACNAKIQGAELKSKTLLFEPAVENKKSDFNSMFENNTYYDGTDVLSASIQLKSPGAVTLVLQAILPFLLYRAPCNPSVTRKPDPSPVKNGKKCKGPTPYLLKIHGGTNVSMSPSVDYVKHVLFPNLNLLGFPRLEVCEGSEHHIKHGWSQGGPKIGEATFLITPLGADAPKTQLKFPEERGSRVVRIHCTVIAADCCACSIASNAVMRAVDNDDFSTPVEPEYGQNQSVQRPETSSDFIDDSGNPKRLYMLLVAETESGIRVGHDWLYDKKIGREPRDLYSAARKLGREVVAGLKEELKRDSLFDSHFEDQIAVYQALSKADRASTEKVISTKPTLHTQTAQWVTKLITDYKADTISEVADSLKNVSVADSKS